MKYNKIRGTIKEKRIYFQVYEIFSINLKVMFLTK
jgi:hypothetical protein